ncbi:MAG: ParB/RepB/Spo0J family partition protein [Pseudomonadota bacterium]
MPKVNEPGKRRPALGQGLEALIPLNESFALKDPGKDIRYVPIDSLRPNPFQPRRFFQEESLTDLSESIKEMGVIQPLIVRSGQDDGYEIVAGERRWRAAKMAQFKTVPVMVKELSDAESLEIALIENLQREDLNALDTAEAYDTLIRKFSYTHEVLAKRIGKDRSNITNYLRLLKLPDPIKEHLRGDQLTMGHARTLLAVDHLPTQLSLTGKVIKRKLSVRELERIVQNYKNKQTAKHSGAAAKDPEVLTLEKALSRHLSAKVVIRKKTNQSGKLEIHFSSADELDGLLEAIGYSSDLS